MNTLYLIVGVIAFGLFLYLIAALFKPENFE